MLIVGTAWRLRITSARAESTCHGGSPRKNTADHLRSRGEHRVDENTKGRKDGSPPLARRARDDSADGAVGERITSARAESTISLSYSARRSADHLRSRGEHPSFS
ncbi:hypothetical protein SBD_2261 [Streptomyces bottropensis ATCC 25435]|uniref:Uncharacterized protein n=1 Tax=Streptomyces bottropensis ATCC 25435 TaxID=1054862 RepID=M3FTR1_9ACTN|nr:hypothetical protein SBD_2261 [Streptomyces bottropensis ATCC 25435]